jgi:hypothetical protein
MTTIFMKINKRIRSALKMIAWKETKQRGDHKFKLSSRFFFIVFSQKTSQIFNSFSMALTPLNPHLNLKRNKKNI